MDPAIKSRDDSNEELIMLAGYKLKEADAKLIAQEGAKCDKLGVVGGNVIGSPFDAKPPSTPAIAAKEIKAEK